MEPTSTLPALLTEIMTAFENERYPGDEAIVAANTGSHSEPLAIRNAFKGMSWQEVPNHILAATSTGLSAMSVAGFCYYLPAFMSAVLRNSLADNAAGKLAQLLKLPIEMNSALVAKQIQQFEAADSGQATDLEAALQQQLIQTNTAINYFVARASQFTKEQGQAIYRFLVYVQNNASNELSRVEARLAIHRFWFQFN